MINAHIKKYNPETQVLMSSNFSSTTTPQLFQKQVESNVDKRMGSTYGPPTGKKMTIFLDDVNMPSFNEWGDQCTNEFLRYLVEMKGFYSLDKPGDFINIVDVQYMAAMIQPGGGRNDIPQRLKRHFIIFNCTIPTNEAIDKIFSTVARGHFSESRGFAEPVCALAERLVPLTRRLWFTTKSKMLPTPAKFHYIFNMRDLSRIWMGMIGTINTVVNTETVLMHLWRHEVTRVLSDRFITDADKEWFDIEVMNTVEQEFNEEVVDVIKEPRYFVDFMRDAPEPTGEEVEDTDMELPKIYEPIESFKHLEERLQYFLDQYNDIIRGSDMDLVFFPDAVIHLIKISRVIRNPGGNLMLVGVGGSGKQSLTKLATFIAGSLSGIEMHDFSLKLSEVKMCK